MIHICIPAYASASSRTDAVLHYRSMGFDGLRLLRAKSRISVLMIRASGFSGFGLSGLGERVVLKRWVHVGGSLRGVDLRGYR